uniref:Putative portal protein n=1 Tax=viral metagenome TaxID=1070528 RepID=A0A6M3KIN7_9ZZZZ
MPWKTIIPASIANIEKSTPSIIPSFYMEPEPKIRVPKYNYPVIYRVGEESWLIQTNIRIVTQEMMKAGWSRIPRFKQKCTSCNSEFQESVKRCPACDGEVRGPSLGQAKIFDRLTSTPSPNTSFGDFLRSVIYHDLMADDWYVSIIPMKKEGSSELTPAFMRVEDSRYWMPIADEYGNLGINEYYCPICYKPDEKESKPGTCKKCGATLLRTSYVQVLDSDIKARSNENWMIHGSTGRVQPELFGKPKIVPVWDLIHAIKAMDEYIYDVFSEGKLSKIINFPGTPQEELDALDMKIKNSLAERSIQTMAGYRPKRSNRTLFLGSESEIKVFDAMPSLTEMNAINHYLIMIQAVCGRFGVQPISLALKSSGERGSVAPFMQVEIQQSAMQEYERDKEEMFNLFLFPKFGITDWFFKFNPSEKRDLYQEALTDEIKVSTLISLREAGFDATFNEQKELMIPSKPTLEAISLKKPASHRQKPKISDASHDTIQGTTTERFPHGPRME